jgi:predicted ABC-type ATPase
MEKITELVDLLLKKAQSVHNPVFIIKYGPPASGKGTCLDTFYTFAQNYGFDSNNFINIDVDYFVEKLDSKKTVKTDPGNYWKFRGTADKISDTLLSKCFDQKKHAVLEMTGSSVDQKWLTKSIVNPARKNNYTIIVVYPLVPKDDLVTRSNKRAASIGRRPDPNYIINTATQAAQNIKTLNKVVDHLIIYDNTTDPPCDTFIIRCQKNVCSSNLKWVIDRVKEKFDVKIELQ